MVQSPFGSLPLSNSPPKGCGFLNLLNKHAKTCHRCKAKYFFGTSQLCHTCRENERIANELRSLQLPPKSDKIGRATEIHNLLAPYAKYQYQHFDLYHAIEDEYSFRHKSGITDMDDIIEWCYQDLSLAPICREFWLKAYGRVAFYPSFKRLAIIYEKQGDLTSAITVCEEAISLGLNVMDAPKRLERLQRKLKENKW